MTTPTKLATLIDVAEAAGVSVGTASKALNGRGQLREQTRQRVHQAAAGLGFRPNELAQSLLRRRSFTIGLLSSDSYGRFSIPVLQGIEDALHGTEIAVFLCNAADDPARERHHLGALLGKRVDGIIVTSRRTDPRAPLDLGGARVPLIYAFARVDAPDALCLLPDDEDGGRQATAHLLRLGRRRVAHVSGPERFAAVRERRAGFDRARAEAGLPVPAGPVLFGAWSEAWGREAAGRVLALDARTDAVVCGSDQIARGVIDGLRSLGRSVPDDVAVVGFDNWDAMVLASRPTLTTIDMNLHELGRRAGLHMLAMAGGQALPGPSAGLLRLPCDLVVRESCAGRPAAP